MGDFEPVCFGYLFYRRERTRESAQSSLQRKSLGAADETEERTDDA